MIALSDMLISLKQEDRMLTHRNPPAAAEDSAQMIPKVLSVMAEVSIAMPSPTTIALTARSSWILYTSNSKNTPNKKVNMSVAPLITVNMDSGR